jgi:hypothetical protein
MPKIRQPGSIKVIIWLTLFWKRAAGCFENRARPINTVCGQSVELLNVEAGGTNTYERVVKF